MDIKEAVIIAQGRHFFYVAVDSDYNIYGYRSTPFRCSTHWYNGGDLLLDDAYIGKYTGGKRWVTTLTPIYGKDNIRG